MHLLTISRQAHFGDALKTRFEQARSQLEIGHSYCLAVSGVKLLNADQRKFHQATYLTGLVSLMESLVYDLGFEYLMCYPGRLTGKNIKLDLLSKAGSVGKIVEELVLKELNELSYNRFGLFVEDVVNLFNKNVEVDRNLLAELSEVKATRDVYVHAGGKINSIYLSKAGDKARSRVVGNELNLGEDYIRNIEVIFDQFISELEKIVPQKFFESGRATTFKAMWEATCLAKIVPFDKGWFLEGRDMVRPKDEVVEWRWSDSERPLLNFFLGIYSEDYPGRNNDVMTALRCWSPETDEGKVMMSWFDNPFWF